MAANPIDLIITKEAQLQLDNLIVKLRTSQEEVLKLAQNSLTASKNLSTINTPSGLTNNSSNNAQLVAQINQQAQAIANLQQQLQRLQSVRSASNQKTVEEIVNQRILNRNALESARINSQLAGAYGRLNAQHSEASRRLQDLVARGKLATQTQQQFNRELRIAQNEFNGLNSKVLTADKAVGRFNRNVGNYPQVARGFSELLGAFGIVGGVGIIASITKDIFNQTRELQSLDLALKQVIGTQDDFNRANQFLSRVSEQYGVGIKELTKSYTQFYVSAKDKLSGSEIEGIFESISKAAGSMGLSVDQQQGAFLALTQMLSKGTVQAEELRGQLSERLPGAFGILAKSMGVTEQQLNKMLKDGQVMAADVLPKFAKELEKAYGIENLQRVESLNASTTRLSNSWTNFIKSLNEGSGAFSGFLQGAINFNSTLLTIFTNLLTSSEKLRKSYLDGQKELGYNSAKEVLSQFKTADERESYANEALIKTRAEIAKNTNEFNRLKKENADINSKNTTNSREVFEDQKILKSNEEKIKALNNLIYKQVGYVNGLKKVLEEENKVLAVSEETDKQKQERLKKEEDRQKQLFINRKKELELELFVIDKTLNDEKMFYQERLVALELHRLKRHEILALQYKEDMRLSKGNNLKQKEALLDLHSDSLKEFEDYNKRLEQIKGLTPAGMTETSPDIQKSLKESAKQATEQIEKQNESYLNQLEILRRLKEATEEYIKSFSNSFLNEAGLGSLQQFFDGTFERLMAGADTLKEKFAVTFLAISEVAQEAFNFINQASQQNFDAEYRRLELQKEVAITFAGESTTAQERINTEYDRRKKEIQRREAEAQKKMAVFNILINTAQGVVSALASTPPNIPLSIAIGVIGAIQAGIVQGQQIPQFFDGGTHKGGIMMVNDAKGNSYKETIVTPDGKVIKPQGRNVLMNAPAGTEIFTPEQWKEKELSLSNMLSERGVSFNPNVMRSFAFNNGTGLSKNDFDNGISQLAKTFKNSPSSQISFDEKGYRKFTIQKGIRTERLNRRFNIG